MIHDGDDNPTVESAERLFERSYALSRQSELLKQLGIKTLEKQIGLVPGVTKVREGDQEAVFVGSVAYSRSERRLWIDVHLTTPLPSGRVHVRFYGNWTKVQT
jgi:hypothetical protein